MAVTALEQALPRLAPSVNSLRSEFVPGFVPNSSTLGSTPAQVGLVPRALTGSARDGRGVIRAVPRHEPGSRGAMSENRSYVIDAPGS